MPHRSVVLANDETYHIFNRSIAGTNIFAQNQKVNLNKAIEIVNYYRFPQKIRLSRFRSLPVQLKEQYLDALGGVTPLVEIYAFAFMSNHFHFLLKQIRDKGVAIFVANFQNSFAKVFNLKNDRSGALFQNAFKAKRIVTEDQFIHVSRYIHLNPVKLIQKDWKENGNCSAAFAWNFKDCLNHRKFPVRSFLPGNFQSVD